MLKKLSWFIDAPAKALFSAFLLLAAIAGLDHFSNYQVSFSSFYLLPILIVTWRINLNPTCSTL